MQQRQAAFGFRQYWFSNAIDYAAEKIREEFVVPDYMDINLEPPEILSPFTLHDLQGSFFLLFIMLFTSFAVLVVEILVGKINRLTE